MSDQQSSKRILSGMQTSGDLHIGNYLGAIKQWIEKQAQMNEGDEFLFMLADLHAITVAYDPKKLQESRLDVTAWYLACGIDPKKVSLFAQSDNPDHSYLAWIFNCITPMGWLERMTQFKDKSQNQERASAGLFSYPTLMAADILLYDADEVPVGDDQKQHVELTRDIVQRFNTLFGDVLTSPKFVSQQNFTRIMSLQDAGKKMSKSDPQQGGVIRLCDSPDEIVKKIKRAVTDSGDSVNYDPIQKPAISNLLALLCGVTGESTEALSEKYNTSGYGDFKNDVAEAVVAFLKPVQARHAEISADRSYIDSVLDAGAKRSQQISNAKLKHVKDVTGISR